MPKCPMCEHSNSPGATRCEKCSLELDSLPARMLPRSQTSGQKRNDCEDVAESMAAWASVLGVLGAVLFVLLILLAIGVEHGPVCIYWAVAVLVSALFSRAWLAWGAAALRCLRRIEAALSLTEQGQRNTRGTQ